MCKVRSDRRIIPDICQPNSRWGGHIWGGKAAGRGAAHQSHPPNQSARRRRTEAAARDWPSVSWPKHICSVQPLWCFLFAQSAKVRLIFTLPRLTMTPKKQSSEARPSGCKFEIQLAQWLDGRRSSQELVWLLALVHLDKSITMWKSVTLSQKQQIETVNSKYLIQTAPTVCFLQATLMHHC